jgi:anhydro-N-acetylmuramic acid kinase
MATAGVAPDAVDLVGFHGQTVLHEPAAGRTIQIGDPARLARRLGIAVVHDFRAADVAAGGQGAPLVPLYHAALARELPHDVGRPLAVLNLGGVGNLTWIGADPGGGEDPPLIAFDTGPGNALIDDWVRTRTGRPFDDDGRLAAGGRIDAARLAAWLGHPHFLAPPPKSLDRDAFAHVLADAQDLEPADGAATLAALTAAAVAAALPLLPAPPRRWLIAGGGRRNPVLMRMLAARLSAPGAPVVVEPVEAVGWRGDALEAEAFAFLAVRSVRRMPLSLPMTTGVPRPQPGGRLVLPPPAAG